MKKLIIFIGFLLLSVTSFSAEKVALPLNDFDSWYYKKSEQYQGWKYIVLHHSATSAGSVNAFHEFHTKQGYGGIAYHFVIGNGNGMRDGEVQETFRWSKQMSGTHVSVNSWQHNVFGVGICLVGNLEKQKPTSAQLLALKKLIRRLQDEHNIRANNVFGHRHVPYDDEPKHTEKTACPGKKLRMDSILSSAP